MVIMHLPPIIALVDEKMGWVHGATAAIFFVGCVVMSAYGVGTFNLNKAAMSKDEQKWIPYLNGYVGLLIAALLAEGYFMTLPWNKWIPIFEWLITIMLLNMNSVMSLFISNYADEIEGELPTLAKYAMASLPLANAQTTYIKIIE